MWSHIAAFCVVYVMGALVALHAYRSGIKEGRRIASPAINVYGAQSAAATGREVARLLDGWSESAQRERLTRIQNGGQ